MTRSTAAREDSSASGHGHSSIGITADTYAHVSANTARESTERLAALIDGST